MSGLSLEPPFFFGSSQAALEGPLDEFSVRELHESRIFLQELVQPIEEALLGKSHRKDAFLLALLADILHRVSLGGRADHVTAEGQRFAGHRAQVHFQRNAPVGDRGEQRLAAHILWNLLGFGGPRAVHEQRHGVLVGRAFLQIYEQRNGLVADELLPRLGARFAEGVEALAIEAHVVCAIGQKEGATFQGETYSEQVLGLWHSSTMSLLDWKLFHDARFEHVPPGLHACVGSH